VSLAGRLERTFDTQMDLSNDVITVVGAEPTTAPAEQGRWFLNLLQPEGLIIEATRFILRTSRHGNLNMVELHLRLLIILTSRSI